MLVQEVVKTVKLSGGPLDGLTTVVGENEQRIVIGYAVQNGKIFLRPDEGFDPNKPFLTNSAGYVLKDGIFSYCGTGQSDTEEKWDHILN